MVEAGEMEQRSRGVQGYEPLAHVDRSRVRPG